MDVNFSQRWTKERKPVFRPIRECINKRDFEVAPIDERTAKDFVRAWHYARSFPVARRRFGLFEKGELVGVAVYSHPMSEKTITNVFKCERGNSGLELGRLVIRDGVKFNASSFLTGFCNRQLAKEGFVGCVTFADDIARYSASGEKIFFGHLGTSYVSTGAAFLARSTPSKLYLLPDGTVFSARAISKIRAKESGWLYATKVLESFGASECPSDDEPRRKRLQFWLERLTRRINHPGNLRFAWSFSPSVKLKSLPYPRIRFSDQQLALNF